VAFWALGEILKAECGILESDSAQAAAAKLERALPLEDRDLPWLRARLSPLVGAGGEPAAQEESFTAWRRFLEGLAAQRPTVLVFEDLHWADEALLVFLEHLADWSHGVPLLLLCTARPELYERHANWAAGLRNATAIDLAPLSDEETALLIGRLLERAVLPPETQRGLLERAGGNPLYAEEFVRLLVDDRRRGAGHEEVPGSVQALIAARLDTLSAERKSLLQDAAVIGKVFWAGALAEMGARDRRDVEHALHELARKELVRLARTSSMAGETEYGFWHLLVRDVCYAQIPRAARAARHRAAAAWIERKAGESVGDLADVLAHHYLTALELGRTAGHTDDAEELQANAIRYLALAGERALPLDVARAEQQLARALALAPAGHPQRAALLERWAKAAQQRGGLHAAKEALVEAVDLYRARSKPVAAGRALTALTSVLAILCDPSWAETSTAALSLLEAEPPGPELVDAYAELAGHQAMTAAFPEALAVAEQTLTLAATLGLAAPARAVGTRGYCRALLGERRGVEDMREALEIGLERGQGRACAILHNNLALVSWMYDGPRAALERCNEGVEFCERRGITEFALVIGTMRPTFRAELGLTADALAEAGPAAQRSTGARDLGFIEPGSVELRLLAACGADGLAVAADELVAAAREVGYAQFYALAFTAAARVRLGQGRPHEARALLAELDGVADIRADRYYASLLPELVRTALAAGDPNLAARLAAGVEPRTPLFEHALRACRAQLAEARGEHAEAATGYAAAAAAWQRFGNVPERAHALLGEGRCLAALAKPEMKQPLRQARDLFASINYRLALEETEALLARTPASAV
jgi:hypothetical protein